MKVLRRSQIIQISGYCIVLFLAALIAAEYERRIRGDVNLGGEFMTSNQLTYWANVETARANAAREEIQRQQNTETQRSNLAREYETSRSNMANELLTREKNTETARHNQQLEWLQNVFNSETARANKEREYLTNRQIEQDWSKFVSQYELDRWWKEDQSLINRFTAEYDARYKDRTAEAQQIRAYSGMVKDVTGAVGDLFNIVKGAGAMTGGSSIGF